MENFITRIQNRRINSRYSLIRKLGQGSYGAVYLGRDHQTEQEVALKLEHRQQEPSVLVEEAERYATFEGLPGFPQMYWYGWQDDYKIMAFELLGPSLADLFTFCDRQFSLKTVIMIMDQLLSRLEALHTKGLLHRDVKPENCLIGIRERGNSIYVIDFGLASEYEMSFRGKEGAQLRPAHLVGTTRYASIRGHQGQEQSPKDDLEALGYMMIYFLRGLLPWQGLEAHNRSEKERLVMEKKMTLSPQKLCSGLPGEFMEYILCVKSLPQGKTPDYAKLRGLFQTVAERERMELDNVFDWTVRWYLDGAQHSLRR